MVEMDVVWKGVGRLESIPRQGARRLCFGHGGRPIAVFRTSDDRIFALVDECPHKRGPLSEGIIAGAAVTCPLHNWTIDLANGTALAPDEGRTQPLSVRVIDGEIRIGLPRLVGAATA
jgi:nitrite reductase (NADH) small subunit